MLGFAMVLAGCSPKEPQSEPVIGLITDFGLRDPYVAEVKGVIYSIHPSARVVDLLHEVEPFQIWQAAYLVEESAREFPKGSIFLAVVDPGVGTVRPPILLETRSGKFFFAPDNGILSLVVEREGMRRAWKLDKPAFYRAGTPSRTFHGRDIFGPGAAHLAAGVDPEQLGSRIEKMESLNLTPAGVLGQGVQGQVISIDRFGNVITNIPRDLSSRLQEGILLRISVGDQTIRAPLVGTYADIPSGKLGALFNSSGYLELVMNKSSAARLIQITEGARILVRP
ncbi:S-adenosyl-l-methionine hydroxide adenosyltransferase family protein [Methylacidimicrobium sp. B4]|uniref:SAM hydrolase/SAM-dependent halogenase family protein n=1 Tax=Methylacidimicrobium sp. B4 TaxID=2796139 RepID=UPI001A8FF5DA|nr:SAM-dependent chlorinase/fluorinase [Methylacidimicrobium sp. B4]QSR84479.1 SAM-dependent chlorinase/fluorinase [Methylacidimicrobium sp. B4]